MLWVTRPNRKLGSKQSAGVERNRIREAGLGIEHRDLRDRLARHIVVGGPADKGLECSFQIFLVWLCGPEWLFVW